VFVGHDLYYFSDAAAKAKFIANPRRYCGRLTDVVSRERFTPGAKSPDTTFHGRRYFFASPETFAQFRAMPDSFAIRRGM
jgi:YHS domain-containing protein